MWQQQQQHHLFVLFFLCGVINNNNCFLCENVCGLFLKDWWDQMSELKPVKCHHHEDVTWQEDLSKYVKTNGLPEIIIYSGQCLPNETPVKFSFKGKVDNFQLKGPGKLKINPKYDRF
jgi:hypothetical protein